MGELEKLYTVEDVAHMMELTSRTIRNYLKDGSLKGRKIGGQWRFTEEDIKNFMDSGHFSDDKLKKDREDVIDFFDGVNTDVDWKDPVCIITDLYIDTETAVDKCNKINELISSNKIREPVRFSYRYNDDEKKARFIIFSKTAMISAMLDILK